MLKAKRLIFIPTYNERCNIEPLYKAIKALDLGADFLLLDDASPDGTGDIIDDIEKEDPQVFTLHRQGKLGIGSAHKAGLGWAYQKGYQQLLTMDADFTHSPEYIPQFFAAIDKCDVVVGSRYLMQNSLATWSYIRKFLTWTAHLLTKNLLDCPYDATSAFRAYRLDKLDPKWVLDIKSDSYSFFFESLHKLYADKRAITEIAIHLPARTYGSSKMAFRDAFVSVICLLKLYKDQ